MSTIHPSMVCAPNLAIRQAAGFLAFAAVIERTPEGGVHVHVENGAYTMTIMPDGTAAVHRAEGDIALEGAIVWQGAFPAFLSPSVMPNQAADWVEAEIAAGRTNANMVLARRARVSVQAAIDAAKALRAAGQDALAQALEAGVPSALRTAGR